MKRPTKNWLEWSVFAISLAIIVGIIGYLAYAALTTENRPPDLRVLVGPAVPGSANTHRLPLVVENFGDQTAEQVTIEVVLREGGRDVERAEMQIAFLPRLSKREGWVVLTRDPRCCSIEARPVGYGKP